MSLWPIARLADVATIDRNTVEPGEVSADTPYIGLENIAPGGKIINVKPVGESDLTSTKFRFTENQVLFGKLRPYLAKISRPNFPGICSTDILPITPGARINRDYLAYFLSQPELISLATSRATGASLPRLSPAELAKFEVPLPPLSEQQRIAEVLDRADELRAKRREALTHLDSLTGSILRQLFSRTRSEWQITTVESIAEARKNSIRTGPFGSQLLHSEFVDSGIPVIGIDNVVNNEFRWTGNRYITEQKFKELARYTVHPGDVLITIMGTCGRCAIAPANISRTINTKHLCCITLNKEKCIPEFLHAYFLHHPTARNYLRKAAKGAIMAGLNMGIIKAMPVHLPPVSLQLEFAQQVEIIQQMKSQHRSHLAELDALFASLQDRAFKGRL
jgi:type I restriction enzyme S subunit